MPLYTCRRCGRKNMTAIGYNTHPCANDKPSKLADRVEQTTADLSSPATTILPPRTVYLLTK